MPQRFRQISQALPAGWFVPVAAVRLDLNPPRRTVKETRGGAGFERGVRGAVGGLAEGRDLVEVAGVTPQRGEASHAALAVLPERVVPEVEPGQRRPQPHVGL